MFRNVGSADVAPPDCVDFTLNVDDDDDDNDRINVDDGDKSFGFCTVVDVDDELSSSSIVVAFFVEFE